MDCDFNSLREDAAACLKEVFTYVDFEKAKAIFFGSNGKIRGLVGRLAFVSQAEKPHFGKLINECKLCIEGMFAEKLSNLGDAEMLRLLGSKIDPTLPAGACGTVHPLSMMQETMADIFRKVGFTVALGPEIETIWYCYDALNVSESHPARDAIDTLYFNDDLCVDNVVKHDNESYILRSQTSTVQIRTMLAEEPPLRIISPGRTFRRDTLDATHSANFHQCEGLVVDRNINVVDLKAILDFFFGELFGTRCEIRFRPSFFPFTEPSFEVDFRVRNMGKLSNCWIEVIGCGMVHPNVFIAAGYDPDVWSGYAFGFGIERLAMLMFEVDDIRLFYQNDTRFLKQFAA
ncbi:MAG: phenylalanine--tRNA ligase subunit alpha [Puniceicoccales bacterium]|jgi:phenylalanyl-tRNA synthetase alpha chain|nr:phenylalanine--tRNA ligase subunit alpha [Puniceicoccales bacterium]